jgi:hypothetical protein
VKLGLLPKEQHILMVFENRMLRRIFVPRGEEVTGDEKIA